MSDNNNGALLRELRERAGMTRSNIYEKYGVSIHTLYNWEKNIAECPEYFKRVYIEKLEQEYKWAEIRKENEFRLYDGTTGEGYSCYVRGESLEWFYPLDNGQVSQDMVLKIMKLIQDGWKIIYIGGDD